MPMAFNLFHPLMLIKQQYPDALNAMIKNTFRDYPIHNVTEVLIEFIPLPIDQYTGDRSAMDAAILFQDNDGNEYLISIETKYIDQLGKNKAKENSLKLKAAKESGMFDSKGIDTISKGCIQIYRNFLLTEKYRFVHGLKESYSIVLAPADHPTTESEIASLHENLLPEFQYKLQKLSLEDFVKSLKDYCPHDFQNWLNWFYDRYLDFNKSEKLYTEFINQ